VVLHYSERTSRGRLEHEQEIQVFDLVPDRGILAAVTLEPTAPPTFLRLREAPAQGDYWEETAREIDCEVRRLIDAQQNRMRTLLVTLKPALLEGALLVLEKEGIAGDDLKVILSKQGSVPLTALY
jgi:ATP-dependent Zn protease